MARDGIAGTMDSAWGLVAIILRGWGAVLGGSGGFGGRGISVPICDVSGALKDECTRRAAGDLVRQRTRLATKLKAHVRGLSSFSEGSGTPLYETLCTLWTSVPQTFPGSWFLFTPLSGSY